MKPQPVLKINKKSLQIKDLKAGGICLWIFLFFEFTH